MKLFTYFILALSLLTSSASYAKPVKTNIVKVVDGDTFIIKGEWAVVDKNKILFRVPGTVKIRILGIDTPEKGYLAKCPAEKELSKRAQLYVNELFAQRGMSLFLDNHKLDKYSGRINSDVYLSTNTLLRDDLISKGFAKPYSGKGAKPKWC